MFCPYLNHCTLHPMNRSGLSLIYSFSRLNQPLTVTTTDIKNANSEIKENLLIPQFHGAVNPVILANINNNVRDDIMEFKTQMEAAAKEHANLLKSQGKQPNPYEISTTYSVTYDKNNFLSFSIFFQEYFNRKHNTIRTSYNYDLRTGNSLSLGDLFRQGFDYRTPLNKIAGMQLKANYPNIAADYKGVAEDQPFYLDNNTLVIYPKFNEFAPVASDIPLIRIPLISLKNILKPQFI